MNGIVKAICISPTAGEPMQRVPRVIALAGMGLQGDRYATGTGSYNRGSPGKRQVTLINAIFMRRSGFTFEETRRNILTEGVELMWLIGKEFQIGTAHFRGVKYCDPCLRPSGLLSKQKSFKKAFHDRGGLIAEIIEGGVIEKGDLIIPPPKNY